MNRPTVQQIIWLFIWLWFGLLILSAEGQDISLQDEAMGIGGFRRGIEQDEILTKEDIEEYLDLLKTAKFDIRTVTMAAIAEANLIEIKLQHLEEEYAKLIKERDYHKQTAQWAEVYFRLFIIVSVFLLIMTGMFFAKGRVVNASGGVYFVKNKKAKD